MSEPSNHTRKSTAAKVVAGYPVFAVMAFTPTLSTHSVHRTVAGSTHQSLIDDEQASTASGRAIRDIVVAVRDQQAAK